MPISFINVKPPNSEPNSIKYHIHKALCGPRPGRSLNTLHASDMTKDEPWCPRKRFLEMMTGAQPEKEYIHTALASTFDFGHAIQQVFTDWMLAAGILVGDWQCARCNHMHLMQHKPGDCLKCNNKKEFNYIEHRFVSAASKLSCGVDVLAYGLGPKFQIVEVKSCQNEDFKKMAGPLAEHKLRTNLYMRIVSESNDPARHRIDLETARVVYIAKGGYGCKDEEVTSWGIPGEQGYSPLKEFVITRDDGETDAVVKGPVQFQQALDTRLIPAGVCVSCYDKRAKACKMHHHCYSGGFPVGKKF